MKYESKNLQWQVGNYESKALWSWFQYEDAQSRWSLEQCSFHMKGFTFSIRIHSGMAWWWFTKTISIRLVNITDCVDWFVACSAYDMRTASSPRISLSVLVLPAVVAAQPPAGLPTIIHMAENKPRLRRVCWREEFFTIWAYARRVRKQDLFAQSRVRP
jgi:hypothetical protein